MTPLVSADDSITVLVAQAEDQWIAHAGTAATGSGNSPAEALSALADNLRFLMQGIDGANEEAKRRTLACELRKQRRFSETLEWRWVVTKQRLTMDRSERASLRRLSLATFLKDS